MMPSTVSAIETTWRGYRFRSRLEARWAVFFETLGLQWEYEPEGFELGDGLRYLPDFLLRVRVNGFRADLYVEVKPSGSKAAAWDKAKQLGAHAPILLLAGVPDPKKQHIICAPACEQPMFEGLDWRIWTQWDSVEYPGYVFTRGGLVSTEGIYACGHHARREYAAAADAARSARFEFAEGARSAWV